MEGHADVGDAVEEEGGGGLAEADLLVEAAGVFLGFEVDAGGGEAGAGGFDGGEHDPAAVTLAADGGDDAADGDFFHVGAGGADAAEGEDGAGGVGEPEVDGGLVVGVHVLVDAVLFDDEDGAADLQQRVEFRDGQVAELLFMEGDCHRGLFRGGEVVLADAAEGADPVFGEFFEGGSGGDAVVGVAGGGVVLIAADVAYVLFHWIEIWLSAKIRIILNNRYLSEKCVRCGSYCGWRWGWLRG